MAISRRWRGGCRPPSFPIALLRLAVIFSFFVVYCSSPLPPRTLSWRCDSAILPWLAQERFSLGQLRRRRRVRWILHCWFVGGGLLVLSHLHAAARQSWLAEATATAVNKNASPSCRDFVELLGDESCSTRRMWLKRRHRWGGLSLKRLYCNFKLPPSFVYCVFAPL